MMIVKANKRTKAERDAARKAEGIALVIKPLRLIRARTAIPVQDPKTGRTTYEESPVARAARYAANKGNGRIASAVARHLVGRDRA